MTAIFIHTAAKRRISRGAFVLAAPAVALMLVFFFLPLCILFVQSADGGKFTSYRDMFSSSLYLDTFVISMRISLLTVVFDLLLAYPLAYYLTAVGPRERSIGFFMLLLPFWSSQLIRSFAWLVIFGRYGVLNNILLSTELIEQPLKLLYTESAVLVGSVYLMLPFMVLPLYATMRQIDMGLVAAARGLGASRLQAFLHVYLPLSSPGVLAGVVLVFVLTLGSYTNAAILGGGKVFMVALTIEQQVNVLLNNKAAGALSLILVIITLLAYWLLARGARRLANNGR